MKAFLAGIIFLIVVAVAGYVGLKYYAKTHGDIQVYKTAAITRRGTLRKVNVPGADFSYVIFSSVDSKSYGVASYTLNLEEYVGKNVEAVGQNSGTTLYADSITVLP
ncbi:hypothetical protein A2Z00_01900 [Candidatus Gottesmanbacteria bacterium RBG_13_45_10]|uniref:Uncharacterized protein n=1 Tax=Candidatus Gottesmanbacteria bacterium RBG_13_45_10 TaxID=1798370 RepID=A0A1F5ZH80_9BACT|nr:MAG: hypothetical protein A2Z00_01900 [Candidatus Gottesmanbacteria bacterium RBG_13_45_10]